MFALGQDGALKGSGRSIAGFHLRDALDLVSKRHPGLLVRFGGHAMAAGCTIARADFETFRSALQGVAREGLDAATLERTLFSDGPLAAEHFDPRTVRLLDGQVWGAAFEAPVFCDAVEVVSQRLVGEKHLKLAVRVGGVVRDAIWFGRSRAGRRARAPRLAPRPRRLQRHRARADDRRRGDRLSRRADAPRVARPSAAFARRVEATPTMMR